MFHSSHLCRTFTVFNELDQLTRISLCSANTEGLSGVRVVEWRPWSWKMPWDRPARAGEGSQLVGGEAGVQTET